jgi:A/G-specific adenine glycosylase
VILQQTRVAQGIGYYERFIVAMPNVSALSEASEQEVLKLWQGLGYYSRARNLHASAKQVMDEFHGVFPSNYTDILRLRGVGK